jgi:hypothetical protein
MDILINTKSEKDHKLILDLANRLGLKNKTLSLEEKEDYALLLAMEEGKKPGLADPEHVIRKLKKAAGR